MIVWPIWMPQNQLQAGFDRVWHSNIRSFQPEEGPAITAPAMARSGADVVFRFQVPVAVARQFRAWWHDTLKGALPFQYLDPALGDVKTYRPKAGAGLREETPDGGTTFTFTLQLEQLP